MKVSMLSISAWALSMMNWLTQAIAWDLSGKEHKELKQLLITAITTLITPIIILTPSNNQTIHSLDSNAVLANS